MGMMRGYGADLIGRFQLRGAARGLQQARQISQQAKEAQTAVEAASAKIRFTMADQLALGLNVMSVIQLTRYSAMDLYNLLSGKGGIGEILSITTSTIINLYRMKQLYEIIIGLQAVSSGLAAGAGIGAFSSGAALTVAGLFAGGLILSLLEMSTKTQNQVDTDRRKVALKWGSLVG
jgi:phage gp36-like protein